MTILEELNRYRHTPMIPDNDLGYEAGQVILQMSEGGKRVCKSPRVLVVRVECVFKAVEVVRIWFESDKRGLIVNPKFTRVGTAYAHYHDGSIWWCAVLGE